MCVSLSPIAVMVSGNDCLIGKLEPCRLLRVAWVCPAGRPFSLYRPPFFELNAFDVDKNYLVAEIIHDLAGI
jgi:hypothetical protein